MEPVHTENSHPDHIELLQSPPAINCFQIGSVSQACLLAPRPISTPTRSSLMANGRPKYCSTTWPPLNKTKHCKQFYSPTYFATPTLKQQFSTEFSTKPATPIQNSPPRIWTPFKRAQRSYTSNWSKQWPKLKITCRKTEKWPSELPDHPGQSRQSRIWRPPSQPLLLQNQSRNINFWNTPQAITAGNALRSNIRSQSKTFSSRIFKPAKGPTKFWVRKLRKSFQIMNCWPNKPPASTTAHLKNYAKAQL
jgi:hypothetical protein